MSTTKESGEESSRAEGRALRRVGAVDKAITSIEEAFDMKKASVGDYVRLVQLQKEIDGEEPKDIEVTWMDQDETKSSDK